jgi:cellulose synthase/poly-beta-1,6-N-acetylglucosamine synthase-like glycosyltransferase
VEPIRGGGVMAGFRSIDPTVGRLDVVIISRNEEAHIRTCIESVLAAAAPIGACEIVLIDSGSSDRTVECASAYPIRMIELSGTPPYCPALGRHVGARVTAGRYVCFVDGDTTIAPGWLEAALRVLDERPEVAAVGGREDQVYYRDGSVAGERRDYFDSGDAVVEVKQLGGNGVYRRQALEAVGSFNPYLRSFEEAELGARLRQAGGILLRIPALMGHHHTPRPDALAEYWRRFRSHLLTGQGQVLRLSLRQGLFLEHARQLNRLVLFVAWLALGALVALASLLTGAGWPGLVWIVVSGLLVAVFALRARSVTKPVRIILDWAVCAGPLVWGCLFLAVEDGGVDLAEAIRRDRMRRVESAPAAAPTARSAPVPAYRVEAAIGPLQ